MIFGIGWLLALTQVCSPGMGYGRLSVGLLAVVANNVCLPAIEGYVASDCILLV